jgi:hypothetical protein
MTGANWLTAKMKINRRILQACMFCLLVLPYGRVSLNRWLFVTRKYKLGFVEDSNPILDSRKKKRKFEFSLDAVSFQYIKHTKFVHVGQIRSN